MELPAPPAICLFRARPRRRTPGLPVPLARAGCCREPDLVLLISRARRAGHR
ncbi:hypothetical protein J2S43_003390 [Catenuloplanes nepalensis]|uniref:Uncharacterized protein n=1 Tax=Catenuloplanes nepalensis TaxID=587533 RepID=A0ABT9MU05_9ACTN|nr:hypothetical protein [Catenuloplanes nepalensis]MDP9794878.1 hypothetical protein [Catenuloplanes nepalensis]